MSLFDEEPDAPIHGECAAEIRRQQTEIDRLTAELEACRKDAERMESTLALCKGAIVCNTHNVPVDWSVLIAEIDKAMEFSK